MSLAQGQTGSVGSGAGADNRPGRQGARSLPGAGRGRGHGGVAAAGHQEHRGGVAVGAARAVGAGHRGTVGRRPTVAGARSRQGTAKRERGRNRG